MRNEIRDAVVTEVNSRVLAACLQQADMPGGMPLDVLVNDTLFHEKKRLELHKSAQERGADLAFWDGVKGRLGRAGEAELRRILEGVISRFTAEILGNFSPRVYALSTGVLPRALPLLLNGFSPRRLMERGIPELADSIILRGRVDALRRCQELGTVILTPTHLSNLDSVVVGWALYALGLPPFTYGAGLNLFSNPMLSFFMRNLGAYRVDRTKKAPLYKDILKEYSTVTLEMGQSQLFFPGGTRSRSGLVEDKLKLGLLSCGLRAYINNLARRKARPRVFVVPCTLSFHLTLEASTLINDHLRLVGKSRYIIDDDESAKPREIARFARNLLALESRIVVSIADPLDVFGNRVDGEGESIDNRGRRVDISRYVLDAQGKPAPSPQRDRVYVRDCGDAIGRAFREHNVPLTTHVTAFTLFEILRASHLDMDLYRLLRTAGDGSGVTMGLLADRVRRVSGAIRALADEGRIQVAPTIARGNPSEIINDALSHFGSYHRQPVMARRGDRVFAENMNLLLYYRNRLDGYGLEPYATTESGAEAAA